MKSYGKYLLILYTILNLNFFSYAKLYYNNQFNNLVKLVNIIPVLIYFLLIILSKQKRSGYFSLPVTFFISSMISGAISAYLYYNQSFYQSLSVSSIFFPFFTYLLLVQLKYDKDNVLMVLKLIFWLTLIVFAIDFYTYPNSLFASESGESEARDTLWIRFHGQGVTIIGALIYLDSYLKTNKIYKVIPFVIAFVFIVFLTGSRTYLFALTASSLFIIFSDLIYSNSRKNKIYTISSLVGIFFIGIYYLQTYIINLADITVDQFSDISNDIRLECINYYATTFQQGIFTQLFGNGFPHSDSELGIVTANAQAIGYYESDIGIIGLWSYFGLLSVIAWILIFWKVFNSKYIQQNTIIVAFFIYIFINSILVYTLFDPGYIIAYIYALYLFTPQTINLPLKRRYSN